MNEIRGVCPVVEVPFDRDGRVDTASFDAVLRHLIDSRVPAVMFPGYASEFYKIDEGERRELTDILTSALRRSGTRAILSVSENATVTAVRRVEQLRESGADLINLLPPTVGRPDRAGVLAHLDAVLSSAGDTPVVLQHAPAETGAVLTPDDILRLRDRHPALVAVKVDANPATALVETLASGPDPIPVFVGYAGLHLLDAYERGASGVWPGCSFVELYQELWTLLEDGDAESARALHRRLAPFLSYWMQSIDMIVAAEKEISARRGIIATPHCRAPAYSLDAIDLRTISRFLSEFSDELERPGHA